MSVGPSKTLGVFPRHEYSPPGLFQPSKRTVFPLSSRWLPTTCSPLTDEAPPAAPLEPPAPATPTVPPPAVASEPAAPPPPLLEPTVPEVPPWPAELPAAVPPLDEPAAALGVELVVEPLHAPSMSVAVTKQAS
jgi:hypothetical protein